MATRPESWGTTLAMPVEKAFWVWLNMVTRPRMITVRSVTVTMISMSVRPRAEELEVSSFKFEACEAAAAGPAARDTAAPQ